MTSHAANTVALGKLLGGKNQVDRATTFMEKLRELGFRLVPVIPLHIVKRKKAAKRGAAKRKAK